MRIGVICEGQTERAFVAQCLAPYLRERASVEVVGVVLSAPFGKGRGGNVSVPRVARFARMVCCQFDRVTTLVDWYGFKQASGMTCREIEAAISRDPLLLASGITERVFRPYVQRHEFEALLLSDPEAFRGLAVLDECDKAVDELKRVRSSFASPEDINHGTETAPSKRILRAFGGVGYSKTEFGVVVASRIGIPRIRAECPRFNRWVTMLEDWEAFEGKSFDAE